MMRRMRSWIPVLGFPLSQHLFALVFRCRTVRAQGACVDSGTAQQCADFSKSFNCYDDMGAQCRSLNGESHPACPALAGIKLQSVCCATCAGCGDFHWQCTTQYSKYYGCNEDLGVVCRDLLGASEPGCTQLDGRLVKLDCCRSCRDIEANDVATLMRLECLAHQELRMRYDVNYQEGLAVLRNTNGCSAQNLHNPSDAWATLPVVCRQAMCKAYFAQYVPACSCFTDERNEAAALKSLCSSSSIWGTEYANFDVGGQSDLCANFAFIAGRVREPTRPMGNPDQIFAVKKHLAETVFKVDSYTRFLWITEVALVDSNDATKGYDYKLVIGIGSKNFLEEVFAPKVGLVTWTGIEYYNMNGPMPTLTATAAPNQILQFPTTTTVAPVVTAPPATTTTTAAPSGNGTSSSGAEAPAPSPETTTTTTTSTSTTTRKPSADFAGLLAQILADSGGGGSSGTTSSQDANLIAVPLPTTVGCSNPNGGEATLQALESLRLRELEEDVYDVVSAAGVEIDAEDVAGTSAGDESSYNANGAVTWADESSINAEIKPRGPKISIDKALGDFLEQIGYNSDQSIVRSDPAICLHAT
ncbi:unnamed protein product [Amoebophrya sp. A120]|nr:unnamed protein product [Amoebophrya sp. A120]|eukprot:GSA120T00018519001.1